MLLRRIYSLLLYMYQGHRPPSDGRAAGWDGARDDGAWAVDAGRESPSRRVVLPPGGGTSFSV